MDENDNYQVSKVEQYYRKLSQHMKNPDSDPVDILKYQRKLDNLTVTPDDIKETSIDKLMENLKKMANPKTKICELAKALLEKWHESEIREKEWKESETGWLKQHGSENYNLDESKLRDREKEAARAKKLKEKVNDLVCKECVFKTYSQYEFDHHKKTQHRIVRPYPCTHAGCEYRAVTEARLEAHVGNVHSVGIFKCRECDYVAKRKPDLDKHYARDAHEWDL